MSSRAVLHGFALVRQEKAPDLERRPTETSRPPGTPVDLGVTADPPAIILTGSRATPGTFFSHCSTIKLALMTAIFSPRARSLTRHRRRCWLTASPPLHLPKPPTGRT